MFTPQIGAAVGCVAGVVLTTLGLFVRRTSRRAGDVCMTVGFIAAVVGLLYLYLGTH
jgi:branched-subunit amino acid ABC-type transport system permease component